MRNVFIYRCFASGGSRGQESEVSNRLRGHFSGWSRIQPSTCLRPRRSSGHIMAPPSLQWPCVPESDGQTGCSQKEAGWLRDREGLYIESCRGRKGGILALKAAFAKRSGGIEMEKNTQIHWFYAFWYSTRTQTTLQQLDQIIILPWWWESCRNSDIWNVCFTWNDSTEMPDVFWQWVLVWRALCAFAASAKAFFHPWVDIQSNEVSSSPISHSFNCTCRVKGIQNQGLHWIELRYKWSWSLIVCLKLTAGLCKLMFVAGDSVNFQHCG